MKTNFTKNKGYLLLALMALGLPVHQSYAQVVSYSFTSCGATGMNGPNQGQVTAAYGPTNLAGNVTIVVPGIQQWTVPTSGMYGIVAAGSAGGGVISSTGCRGRIVSGEVNLTAGTVLKILVGQKGDLVNGSSGGGGGSFVSTLANVPIIVGGGGGGYLGQLGSAVPATDASYAPAGNSASDGTAVGGTAGGGGGGSSAGWGGGGGGFTGNGVAAVNCVNTGGISFINGGTGGGTCNNTNGGFGGGGGTHGNTGGGGGGGGYSGGGGCSQNVTPSGGGGGGSFQAANMINTADLGYNVNAGYVTITRLCNVSLNTSANPICIGGSVVLSTDAASGISWSSSPSTANSITVTPTTTTSYSVTGTSTANCVAGTIVTVTVNPLPVLGTVVTPTTLCVGKTATITASGASTYTWNGGPTGVNLTVNPGVTTTYNLSGTSQFGCLNTAQVVVNVNTNSLTVVSTTAVCLGNALNLVSSGAVTYTWSNGSMFSTTQVTPNQSATYTINATDNFGCKLSNQVAVTVNPKPTIGASSNKQLICKGENVVLTGTGGTTYAWSNGATGSPVNVVLPVDVVYTFNVTGTDANGCSNTAIVTVNVSKCVGIDEAGTGTSGVRAYPNPASSELTIELNNGSVKSVEVIDLTGKVVLSAVSSEPTFNIGVSKLADGVYYVKVISDEKSEVIKVVKQSVK